MRYLLLLLLSGCSVMQARPPTYGSGTNELKKSACSEDCGPEFYREGKWL